MPGFSLLYDFKDTVERRETEFLDALDSLLHTEKYTRGIMHRGRNYILGNTGYPGYPVTSFSSDRFLFFLEGSIYNKSRDAMEKELTGIAPILFQDHIKGKSLLSDWISGADGEFIICICDRSSGEIVLFNDPLGHLPLYYSRRGDCDVISREIGLFREFPSRAVPDRMSIAQYLVFAFPLGQRTLFEGVSRLPRGTMLFFSPRSTRAVMESLQELNFEEKQHAGLSLRDSIDGAATRFETACRDRANQRSSFRNILSLSGGLDSRAVAAGLYRSDIPFEGVTFLDYRGAARKDLEIARQVAESFRIPWRSVDLPPANGNDTFTLLRLKQGLNYSSTRFLIPFLRRIESLYGPDFNHYNGNTGMILRDYRPARTLKSLDDMIGFILSKGGRFSMLGLHSIHEASRLTGIGEKDILDEMRREISSYPEQSFDQKYVHFVFAGYCFNWHYEGIDMQRGFFWSHTPLESTPFFRFVMNCRDEWKASYTFYREFISRLAPETADIPNASWKTPVHSRRARLKFAIRAQYNRMPSFVKVAMRALFRHPAGYAPESGMMRCFREQMRNSAAIGEYLDPKRLRARAEKYSRVEFDTLFSITSLIEQTATGDSTLRKFGDTPLE